ncbi:unnamed protein product [Moneuplotes crassus]|uniref:Uncharacterized protein n=1 Tax=Euplotes crassus TaxID=5936 RepID=A0AAD2CZ18_EUPCR|nr:unnamed protein product [Moneuplotes crassus]
MSTFCMSTLYLSHIYLYQEKLAKFALIRPKSFKLLTHNLRCAKCLVFPQVSIIIENYAVLYNKAGFFLRDSMIKYIPSWNQLKIISCIFILPLKIGIINSQELTFGNIFDNSEKILVKQFSN